MGEQFALPGSAVMVYLVGLSGFFVKHHGCVLFHWCSCVAL